jgi:acyl-coenzyme A thioesterase PaaI-like protein
LGPPPSARPPSGRLAEEGTGDIAPWSQGWQAEPGHGEVFEQLIAQLRRLQDLAHGTRPPIEVVTDVALLIEEAAGLLAGYPVAEEQQLAAKQVHRPGRSQALIPPIFPVELGAEHAVGVVRFGRYYLGGGGAAHGGAIPLVFDEVLGRLAGSGGRARSRTAFLHVNYRNVTPLDTELTVEGDVDRIDGRKIWTSGRLLHGDILCADAEALFVLLNPGQP